LLAVLLACALFCACAPKTQEPLPEKEAVLPEAEDDRLWTAVPALEPEPEAEPVSELEPEPGSEPASAPEPEPASEPASAPEPEPEPSPQSVPVSAPEPAPASEPEPEPAPASAPEPAGSHTEEREDGLYYVQEDGSDLKDGAVGYLYFGADGRYTSGDTGLDEQIDTLLAAAVSDPEADAETRLREAYVYIRDNFGYLGVAHYAAGTTDWLNEAALFMLQNGKSNCYGFAAVFCCCARRLGYQAYVVAGHEYSTSNEHAWTMIDWPDGETYLFDVQLECAYLYIYTGKPKTDMFKTTGQNGSYGGHAYYFP